ncbi:MAG: peptidyl-prolyl cis-trans isomerase [Candidatus Omnitrophota bacterium]
MKKIIIYISVAVVIASAAMAGCAKKPPAGDKILARVGNKVITLAELQSRIAKMPPYYRNMVEKNRKRFLDETIVEMMFYEEAVKKGVENDKEVKEVVEAAKKKILIAKLIKNEIEDKAKVSEDEMKKFYEENKESFKGPAMWRASHILVTTEKEAREILDELTKGANFENLAKERSMDATADRGGDVGYFRQGQLVEDFEKACLKLEVGQTSDVVHTQFGYHIIKLTDKKEPEIQSYEETRRFVESELKKKKRSELFDTFVMDLKKKYGVEIKEDVFKSLEDVSEKEGEKLEKN